jgi:hypothetical protein
MLEEADRVARVAAPRAEEAHAPPPNVFADVPDDAFDRAYVTWAVAIQERALEVANRAGAEARDPNVKALAVKAAAHLKAQLEIYRELAQSLG